MWEYRNHHKTEMDKNYEKWLKDNKYTASNEKEIEYVQHLFTSKDKSLKTPWDKLDEVSVLKAINDKREKNKQLN